MSVAIVDYGSGNLHSAAKAFERAARESGHDQPIVVASKPDEVVRADRVVLRLTFRDLTETRKAQTKVFIGTDPATDEGFIAYTGHRPGTAPVTQLWEPTDQEFGGTPVECSGIRAKWRFDVDRVRIVVPQACLASAADRYRFKAVAGFYKRKGDWTAFRTVKRG